MGKFIFLMGLLILVGCAGLHSENQKEEEEKRKGKMLVICQTANGPDSSH